MYVGKSCSYSGEVAEKNTRLEWCPTGNSAYLTKYLGKLPSTRISHGVLIGEEARVP